MREKTILNTTARYAAIERVKRRMIEKGFRVETLDRATAAERITSWLSWRFVVDDLKAELKLGSSSRVVARRPDFGLSGRACRFAELRKVADSHAMGVGHLLAYFKRVPLSMDLRCETLPAGFLRS
jgi:hypothetical protein